MKISLYIVAILAIVQCNNLRNLEENFNWNTVYNELISTHNTKRQNHGVSSLSKLTAIEANCQQTANNCKENESLIHSTGTYQSQPLGQNLYMYAGRAPTGSEITEKWYSEEANYDYVNGKSSNGGVIGHFTQLVWKNTNKIGCAYAQGKYKTYSPAFYVCCNYYPAGNYNNQYIQNVFRPTS